MLKYIRAFFNARRMATHTTSHELGKSRAEYYKNLSTLSLSIIGLTFTALQLFVPERAFHGTGWLRVSIISFALAAFLTVLGQLVSISRTQAWMYYKARKEKDGSKEYKDEEQGNDALLSSFYLLNIEAWLDSIQLIVFTLALFSFTAFVLINI